MTEIPKEAIEAVAKVIYEMVGYDMPVEPGPKNLPLRAAEAAIEVVAPFMLRAWSEAVDRQLRLGTFNEGVEAAEKVVWEASGRSVWFCVAAIRALKRETKPRYYGASATRHF